MSWNNKEEIETTCTLQQWRLDAKVLYRVTIFKGTLL